MKRIEPLRKTNGHDRHMIDDHFCDIDRSIQRNLRLHSWRTLPFAVAICLTILLLSTFPAIAAVETGTWSHTEATLSVTMTDYSTDSNTVIATAYIGEPVMFKYTFTNVDSSSVSIYAFYTHFDWMASDEVYVMMDGSDPAITVAPQASTNQLFSIMMPDSISTGVHSQKITVVCDHTSDGGSGFPQEWTDTFTVSYYAPLSLAYNEFSASVNSGTAPLTVSFSCSPSGGSGTYSYSWSFGDQTADSTQQNPTHQYTSAGTFTVTLTVTDELYYHESQWTDVITVTASDAGGGNDGDGDGTTAGISSTPLIIAIIAIVAIVAVIVAVIMVMRKPKNPTLLPPMYGQNQNPPIQ